MLGLVSGYTTKDGAEHAMADVWFAKDTTPAAANVSINDVLAAPTADLTAGLTSAAVTPASTAASHASIGAVPRSLLDDDNKPLPLI